MFAKPPSPPQARLHSRPDTRSFVAHCAPGYPARGRSLLFIRRSLLGGIPASRPFAPGSFVARSHRALVPWYSGPQVTGLGWAGAMDEAVTVERVQLGVRMEKSMVKVAQRLGGVQQHDPRPAAREDRAPLVRAGSWTGRRVGRKPLQQEVARGDRRPEADLRHGLRHPRQPFASAKLHSLLRRCVRRVRCDVRRGDATINSSRDAATR